MFELSVKVAEPSQRLRVLFLAPFAPNLQADQEGAKVVAQLISHLGQRYAVGLCYLRMVNEPAMDHTLQQRCEVIEEVILPNDHASGIKRWSRRLRDWKELLAGKPLWASHRSSPAYEKRLSNLLAAWQPDIVQMEFHVMGQYLRTLNQYPLPRILVEHQPGVESARESMSSPFRHGRVIPLLDFVAWRRFEPKVIREVDAVVVFTDQDRTAVRNLGQKTPMVQIALGTDMREPDSNTEEQVPEQKQIIAAQARAQASANLSWERVAAEYEKLYRCLLRC